MTLNTLMPCAAAALLLSLAPARAEDPAAPCRESVYRAFDFWLGRWTVTAPDGKPAGTNVITEQEGGCLILEQWTSVSGGTGQSYNFYDPGGRAWRQVWVSASETIDYAGGLNEAGAMVLEGEIAYRNGTRAPFRGVWTPNADGSVTQRFEQFNPEADEWILWFEGIYRKAR